MCTKSCRIKNVKSIRKVWTVKEQCYRSLSALGLELPETVHKHATAAIKAYIDELVAERDGWERIAKR